MIVNIWGENFYHFFDLSRAGVLAPLYVFYIVLVIFYISFLSLISLRNGNRRKGHLALLAIFFFVAGLLFDFLFVVNLFPVMPLSGFSSVVFIVIMSGELFPTILRSAKIESESRGLKEIDRLKSRFFTNISHELRTPLSLIMAPIEKALQKNRDPEIRKELQIARINAGRLLTMVNQILTLSKPGEWKPAFNPQITDVIALIKGILMSFKYQAGQKQIHLRYECNLPEIRAWVDHEKFEQAMCNLLSNALKFTPPGGAVTVKVNQTNGNNSGIPRKRYLEIQIKDTGKGISRAYQRKIFNRFFQVDTLPDINYEGAGIGLAWVKEVVEWHHGHIKVNSTPGKGSTFILYLPIGSEHLEGRQVTEDYNSDGIEDESDLLPVEANGKVPKRRPALLIIEDNEEMGNYLKHCLRKEYKVILAKDGEEGWRRAKTKRPDMIISDIMMPFMDGYQLTRKLKSNEDTSHIPVLLMTVKTEQEDRLKGLEWGADDYLSKPFSEKELQLRLKNILESRRRLKERFQQELGIHPGELDLPSPDRQFLNKAIALVEENMADGDYNVQDFVKDLGMSRTRAHHKIKALSGCSASAFIRLIRLKRARQLLEQKQGSVTEIALRVGFYSISYFSTSFQKQFGIAPSSIIHS